MTDKELWDKAKTQSKLKSWSGVRRLNPVWLHYQIPQKERIVSQEKFKSIINTYFTLLTKIMIQTGYVYALPYRLGEMVIAKFPVKGKKLIDFKHYNETGEIRKRRMDFGDGYVPKVIWIRNSRVCRGYALETIKINPTRHFHRQLSNDAKTDSSLMDKYIVPNRKKVRKKVFKIK